MTTVGGLPAHILLVHAVVGLVPLSALGLVLVALWPTARRRLAIPAAVLAVLTLVLVPVTTDAGEWLEHRVDSTALLRAHTELGDTMVPWSIGIAVVALAVAAREFLAARARRVATPVATTGGPGTTQAAGPATGTDGPGGRVATVLLAVVAVVVAVGSVVTVYRIGDSGARAVWEGHFSAQAHPRTRPPGTTQGD